MEQSIVLPSWFYHRDGTAVLVKTEAQYIALGIFEQPHLWAESPAGPWPEPPAAEPPADYEPRPDEAPRKKKKADTTE